jgi:hypothetical protein
MTAQVPLRVRFGMLLILAFAAASDIQWLRTAAAARKWAYGQDEVSLNDERFRPLRGALSPRTTVVGYVTSPPPEPPCSTEAALYQTLDYRRNVFKRYVLTQYALAPVIVVDDTRRDSIVGSFAVGDSTPQLPPGTTLVRDFGGGIVLLSRLAR